MCCTMFLRGFSLPKMDNLWPDSKFFFWLCARVSLLQEYYSINFVANNSLRAQIKWLFLTSLSARKVLLLTFFSRQTCLPYQNNVAWTLWVRFHAVYQDLKPFTASRLPSMATWYDSEDHVNGRKFESHCCKGFLEH